MTQWGMTIIEHGQEYTFKGRSYHSIVESSAERDLMTLMCTLAGALADTPLLWVVFQAP